MRRLFASAASMVACGLVTGCCAHGFRHVHADGSEIAFDIAAQIAVNGIAAAIDAADAPPPPPPPPRYVTRPVIAPSLPPRVTEPLPEHARFDAAAAVAAIHAIDLSACVDRGAPRGYGHARVTFASDGHASVVAIDAPPGMTKDAVACVGETLGHAAAPPFDGAPITVGASYLVR